MRWTVATCVRFAMFYAGILLISAASLLLELALLRLFAVQQFYHFAFMAVSLALLGAGASGSLLSVWPRRVRPALLCLAFSATTVAAYLVINTLPFDSFRIAWDRRQLLYLAAYFLAAAVPFFFAGWLVGGALIDAGRPDQGGSHRLYGANLIGSAIGALASLPLLSLFGGPGSLVFTALAGAVAGLFLAGSRRLLLANALAALAGAALLARPPALFEQRLSAYKALSVLMQAYDARHVLTVWDATARLDVVESSTIHAMPGLSLNAPVGPPPQAGLMLDGDNLVPLNRLSPDTETAAQLASYLPAGLLYRLRPQGRTLVIAAGAGSDVLFALAAGARQVTALEENALLLRTLRHDLGQATAHLFERPDVTVLNLSGRVYAHQPGAGPFDLVIVSLSDAYRPVTSGAYSLTENYVYTVEAFRDYLRLLAPDGVLAVTRWLQTPPSESGRTFATLATALRQSGREPAGRLLAFRTLRTMTILAGARPFTPEEKELARATLQQRGFDLVYLAGMKAEEANRFNVLHRPLYYQLFQEILQDPAGTYAGYRFDIRPPGDDRPFFFHYFKWTQTPEILANLGTTWQPFGGSGYFVLVALLLLVSLAAAGLIIAPLLLWHRAGATPRGKRGPVFLYFACLGLAFLFVEMPLAQRFILLLGQPVTALAAVLFTLLLFSGLGSLNALRWPLCRVLALLVLLIALYPWLLPRLAALALPWPLAARMAVTVLALAPPGFLMGVPFAAGLRRVEEGAPALVPWAWAINGSFSVISAVLAVMLALSWGFSLVLVLGAAAYGGALLVSGRPGFTVRSG